MVRSRARPSLPRRSFTPAPAPRYASLVLSFVILLLGLIAADENEHNLNNGNKGAGFAAIWTTFVLVAVAAAGTSLLRSPAKSPLGVGALLGAVVMLSQMMLTLFAVFIGLARENEEDDAVDDAGTNDADRGLAAFYFLQFVCFTLFAAILAFHRTLVIDGPDAAPPAPDAVSETASPVAENPAAEAPAAEPSAALA